MQAALLTDFHSHALQLALHYRNKSKELHLKPSSFVPGNPAAGESQGCQVHVLLPEPVLVHHGGAHADLRPVPRPAAGRRKLPSLLMTLWWHRAAFALPAVCGWFGTKHLWDDGAGSEPLLRMQRCRLGCCACLCSTNISWVSDRCNVP